MKDMIPTLFFIMLLLLLTYLVGELFMKHGLPRVVGQLLVGIVLGLTIFKPYLFTAENSGILEFLANLGAILLFYYVGLETNFRQFQKNITQSVTISMLNTLLPLVVGFSVSYFLFNLGILPSILIGACLSVSAQSVSVDILEEMGIIKSKLGGMIVGAGAVDDTLEMLIISSVLALLHFSINGMGFGRFILGIFLFLMVLILSRIWLIPYALKFFDHEHSATARFTGSLIIVLLIASIAEFFGVGALIGAMLAGMIVRQTIFKDVEIPRWEEHQMATSIHLIAFGFLIPLFFVWVGAKADLSVVSGNVLPILIFVCIAIACTVIGTVIAVKINRGSLLEGLTLGWGLTPKGDVELIIATTALAAGIITMPVFTALIIVSMVTTIIAPIVFKKLAKRYIDEDQHAKELHLERKKQLAKGFRPIPSLHGSVSMAMHRIQSPHIPYHMPDPAALHVKMMPPNKSPSKKRNNKKK